MSKLSRRRKKLNKTDRRYIDTSIFEVLDGAPRTRWISWTDGSGTGRGGSTGSGAIVVWRPDLRTLEGAWMAKIAFAPGQYLSPKGSTNNTAELMAIRIALSVFRPTTPLVRINGDPRHPFVSFRHGQTKPHGKILVCSDSEWSIKSLTGQYSSVKKNRELRESCEATMRRWEKVKFQHVKGHAGHLQNEICDRLATEARYTVLDEAEHVGFARFDLHTIVEGEERVATLQKPQLCLPNGTAKILAPKPGPKSSFSRSLARTTSNGADY